jgi:hypothetical protein
MGVRQPRPVANIRIALFPRVRPLGASRMQKTKRRSPGRVGLENPHSPPSTPIQIKLPTEARATNATNRISLQGRLWRTSRRRRCPPRWSSASALPSVGAWCYAVPATVVTRATRRLAVLDLSSTGAPPSRGSAGARRATGRSSASASSRSQPVNIARAATRVAGRRSHIMCRYYNDIGTEGIDLDQTWWPPQSRKHPAATAAGQAHGRRRSCSGS